MTDSLPGLATSLSRLGGGRRWLAAFCCGLAFALAQPPLGLWPLIFIAGPILFWIWRSATGRASFYVGLAFGAGYFGLGLHWIVEPFLVRPEIDGWMAPPALIAISFGMGLFPAAGFWLAGQAVRRGAAAVPALALGWGGMEVMRSSILTGFPWALPAYVWVDTPVAQTASLIGPYGLSLATLALCLTPASAIAGRFRIAGGAITLAIVGGAWGWGAAQLSPTDPDGRPIIRIVQPNITQATKWDVALIRQHFEKTLTLTARTPEGGRPSLILWPESAVTFPIDMADEARLEIARVAGAEVALGSLRVDGGPDAVEIEPLRWRNSLFLLGQDGALSKPFDKVHLVPFGEYLPFESILSQMGILAIAQRGAGIVPGESTVVLTPQHAPAFAPLICYEMIFPGEVMAASEGADWLALVTNDAWFGDWAGPIQHLAQAQMRAIETGLPIARAANTGISAMIDPFGRVTASLPMNEDGVIDAPLPAKRATLYREVGEMGSFALAMILAIFAIAGRRRQAQT